jgi:hypothetical protein
MTHVQQYNIPFSPCMTKNCTGGGSIQYIMICLALQGQSFSFRSCDRTFNFDTTGGCRYKLTQNVNFIVFKISLYWFLSTTYTWIRRLKFVLTLVPRSWIFLPWRWRRYVPPKYQFTQDLHGAISQKTAFFSCVFTFESMGRISILKRLRCCWIIIIIITTITWIGMFIICFYV